MQKIDSMFHVFDPRNTTRSLAVVRRLVYLVPILLFAFAISCSDSDDPVVPKAVVKVDTIPSGEIGPFIPDMVRGDDDFNQNGPVVTLKAELGLRGPDSLICTIYMKAEETEPDWSTAEGEWETLVYIAPNGWRITGICANPPFCHQQYIDYDEDWDWLYCPSFIFRSQGDTPGADIYYGTEVWVQIRCTEIRLEKL